MEYDIAPTNKRTRILTSISYNSNGKPIRSYTDPYPKWRSVVPESYLEKIHDLIVLWVTYKHQSQ